MYGTTAPSMVKLGDCGYTSGTKIWGCSEKPEGASV